MALIVGTNFSDEIQAGTGGEEIRGVGGDDTLLGGIGKDTLAGNTGNDLIYAARTADTASGNDSLLGGQGFDTVVGSLFGFGGDSLGGNKGNDLLLAATGGSSLIFGGQDNDTVYGSVTGSSIINGNLGDDVLFAGSGGDRILGDAGLDTITGGKGTDNLFGGDNADTFQFFSQSNVSFPFLPTEQNVRTEGGFGGADTILDFGAGDTIRISKLDRNATVSVANNAAGAAVITIAGTATNGQSAAQTITVANTSTTALLAPGSQLLSVNGVFITTASPGVSNVGGTSTYTVGGAPGNIAGLNITGSQVGDDITPTSPTAGFVVTVNDDTLSGLGGPDTIDGGLGNDIISGGDGNDLLYGSNGFDTVTGGLGNDAFVFRSIGEAVDSITDFSASGTVALDVINVFASGFNINANAGTTTAPTTVASAVLIGVNGQYAAFTQGPGQFGAQDFTAVYSTVRGTFYYDTSTSNLFFDADGTATASSFVLLANVPMSNSGTGFIAPPITVI